MKKRLYILLALLVAFVPLGLISENPAWGEWDLEYYKEILGFVPKGMENNHSSVLIPDYEIPGFGVVSGYYISAIVGILLIFGIYYAVLKVLRAKNG
ncbi:MAG: cobalamin biosynthesis protein [Epsilonproteobacteria bacterium]|nr:cobalamin biosynthesis protein [Campylobacterota bacterium]